MKNFKLGITLIIAVLVLSACASSPGRTSWTDDWRKCAAAGGMLGAGAGAVADEDVEGGAAGLVIGAVVAGFICSVQDTDADGVINSKDECPGTTGGSVDSRGCMIDSDGDGVADDADECPGTPAGEAVDARGCEEDSDNDGVPNRLDKCPGTPPGAEVNAAGCELDADGDGVVDRLDKCPGTPAGTTVDNSGCELESPVVLEGVNFELDSSTLTADSTATLNDAVQILKRHSDLAVELAGHTDSQGSDEYNQGLSERRAQAVSDYLVAHGVNGDNLTARGYGESAPVADNATDAGRASNRRVEMRH